MNIKLHHIGFVVEDMHKNIQIFELIGFKREGNIIKDLIQNNFLQMMSDSSGNKIELIKPINESSTVNKNNIGIHHLAFQVDDENELKKRLKEKKIGKIFTEDIPAPLFNNKKVSFGILKNELLFEIIYK